MDSKFHVSLRAEELLLEKGYHIEKDTPIYNKHGDVIGCYPADRPTKAEAIDWLESKGIIIEVFSVRIGENRKWCYSIINTKTGVTIETPYKFTTRLEAKDAAIIKALELL